ncbi:uncharacterized protein ACNLHF_013730 isoform 2-T3 [Anomaloglossus baeobatrachus]
MMVLSISGPPRMEQDRDHMAARILDLTLEIIYWITGEDHTVVKTSSGECVTPRVSGGRSRTPSAITEPPPHSLIHEQKILELTHRITELLSGEVPIRCQDVTVYFSMEEWEYLEGHKDLYKEVMMEDPPSITSPDGSSQRNPPERSPRPLYSQDRPEKEENVPRDHQVDEVVTVGSLQKVSGEMTRELENPTSLLVNGDQSPIQFQTENRGKNFKNKYNLTLTEQIVTDEQKFSCSECGKCFTSEIQLNRHKETHTEKKMYSCPECGNHFSTKTFLQTHLRIHTKKQFPCPKCRKCFKSETHLKRHQTESHTEKKPYSCTECGKCFKRKPYLSSHLITHTREKPFPCPECGKCFKNEIQLKRHKEIHTEEKPYSCPECGKCFKRKPHLSIHLKIHTGEKAYLCPECGKSFSHKSHILVHLRCHTGEKPFLCTDCGKCFAHKSNLDRHKKSHKQEKRF